MRCGSPSTAGFPQGHGGGAAAARLSISEFKSGEEGVDDRAAQW